MHFCILTFLLDQKWHKCQRERKNGFFFGKLSFLYAKLNRKKIIKQKMHGAESFVALPTPIRKETRKIKWN